jgi:hypothetical protein
MQVFLHPKFHNNILLHFPSADTNSKRCKKKLEGKRARERTETGGRRREGMSLGRLLSFEVRCPFAVTGACSELTWMDLGDLTGLWDLIP